MLRQVASLQDCFEGLVLTKESCTLDARNWQKLQHYADEGYRGSHAHWHANRLMPNAQLEEPLSRHRRCYGRSSWNAAQLGQPLMMRAWPQTRLPAFRISSLNRFFSTMRCTLMSRAASRSTQLIQRSSWWVATDACCSAYPCLPAVRLASAEHECIGHNTTTSSILFQPTCRSKQLECPPPLRMC